MTIVPRNGVPRDGIPDGVPDGAAPGGRRGRYGLGRLLLLLPVMGLLWVPFYDRPGPALFGFPFFYWYQLAWVPLTSLLISLAWRLDRS